MLLLILVLIIAVAEADYNIIGKFPYCYPKDKIFEIDFQNGLLFNSLNLLRLNEDEFQFININGEPMIIFSNNGLLFTTTKIYMKFSYHRFSVIVQFIYQCIIWKEIIKT